MNVLTKADSEIHPSFFLTRQERRQLAKHTTIRDEAGEDQQPPHSVSLGDADGTHPEDDTETQVVQVRHPATKTSAVPLYDVVGAPLRDTRTYGIVSTRPQNPWGALLLPERFIDASAERQAADIADALTRMDLLDVPSVASDSNTFDQEDLRDGIYDNHYATQLKRLQTQESSPLISFQEELAYFDSGRHIMSDVDDGDDEDEDEDDDEDEDEDEPSQEEPDLRSTNLRSTEQKEEDVDEGQAEEGDTKQDDDDERDE